MENRRKHKHTNVQEMEQRQEAEGHVRWGGGDARWGEPVGEPGGGLPDASMRLGCPRRSGTSREEPGMLTGSERTGWILHGCRRVTHTHTQPHPSEDTT